MKNLANCKPTEFLRQANKIRKYVAGWLKATEIMEIRKKLPELPEGASSEEKKNALRKQASENFAAILDSVMETHADETLVLLGMLCFVEPEDIDNHPVRDYIGAFSELLNCEEVIDFFTSLTQWAKRAGLTA